MTSSSELEQLAVLAEIDDLIRRVRQWHKSGPAWDAAEHARALVGRILSRVESLRIRLETPLVVATFGGTGTGKSTLVNALVGQEVTPSGRQRPTTKTPVLLIHPDLDPQSLGFDVSEFQVRVTDAPVLKDIVIIDCPDPDTSETSAAGSNLALLRAIVPHCDVLIYTSTQQKYRSARVVEELADVAGGCRLVFVQTHADMDSDIRDDWKHCLSSTWQVPEMFFVDSVRAMKEQQQGQRAGGDFGRLLELLTHQLGTARRIAIRRANLIDLLEEAIASSLLDYSAAMPAVDQLMASLEDQRSQLRRSLTQQLRDELLLNQNLWERRVLSAVTDMWGFSPFSAVLRIYNGLGAFVASLSLFRARTSAQMALIGAIQGARWLKSRAEENEAGVSLDRLASFGLSDGELQTARMVISGYVRSAGISPGEDATGQQDFAQLRRQAAAVENEFLVDARRGIDRLIEELAAAHCSRLTRIRYETVFMLFPAFLLSRIGYNFFWSSFLAPILRDGVVAEPLLSIDFYVPASIFLLIWSGVLVLSFTWGIRRGLTTRIEQLASQMADHRLPHGLFPSLEMACHSIVEDRRQLQELHDRTQRFRKQLAASSFLGGRRGKDS